MVDKVEEGVNPYTLLMYISVSVVMCFGTVYFLTSIGLPLVVAIILVYSSVLVLAFIVYRKRWENEERDLEQRRYLSEHAVNALKIEQAEV